jgi:hypothetical protein
VFRFASSSSQLRHTEREVFADTAIATSEAAGRHFDLPALLKARLPRQASVRDEKWLIRLG